MSTVILTVFQQVIGFFISGFIFATKSCLVSQYLTGMDVEYQCACHETVHYRLLHKIKVLLLSVQQSTKSHHRLQAQSCLQTAILQAHQTVLQPALVLPQVCLPPVCHQCPSKLLQASQYFQLQMWIKCTTVEPQTLVLNRQLTSILSLVWLHIRTGKHFWRISGNTKEIGKMANRKFTGIGVQCVMQYIVYVVWYVVSVIAMQILHMMRVVSVFRCTITMWHPPPGCPLNIVCNYSLHRSLLYKTKVCQVRPIILFWQKDNQVN